MFKQTARQLPSVVRQIRVPRTALSKRFLSTAPPHQRSRSWKSSLARWGLAGGLLYYYNTSQAFADEPGYKRHAPPETRQETEQENYPTIEELAAQRKAQKQAASSKSSTSPPENPNGAVAGGPEELEEEAEQQGAFNEETGEINWDCPCLGGMAHGPCGEEFRAAFSCFVYSKEEPKGVDCIDKFKGMQDCFRAHPEEYGAELEDEEDPELVGEAGTGAVPPGAEVGVGAASVQSGPTGSVKDEQSPKASAPGAITASVKEQSE